MQIQSVLFRRSAFRTREECKAWLIRHRLRHYTSRATPNYYRWRQFPPKPGQKYRIVGDGNVRFVVVA